MSSSKEQQYQRDIHQLKLGRADVASFHRLFAIYVTKKLSQVQFTTLPHMEDIEKTLLVYRDELGMSQRQLQAVLESFQ